MLVITSLSLSQLTGGCHPAEQFDWLQFQNRQHQKSAMKKRNGGREEEVTDCDRILRTSEKKMMRRERESGVSLDDTAAAEGRPTEGETEREEESRFGSCYVWNGMGRGRESTVFLRSAWVIQIVII